MIDAAILPRFLNLDRETGRLFWRERDKEMALLSRRPNPLKALGTFNTRYAGQEAFTAIGSHGYRTGSVLGKKLLAHRVVWALENGAWPTGEIDHINGDKQDNRPVNLRLATSAQNGANASKGPGTSRFKGVYYSQRDKTFCADIQKAGTRTRLGSFESEAEAARAYDRAAIDLFGEFARTNASLGLFNQEKIA